LRYTEDDYLYCRAFYVQGAAINNFPEQYENRKVDFIYLPFW